MNPVKLLLGILGHFMVLRDQSRDVSPVPTIPAGNHGSAQNGAAVDLQGYDAAYVLVTTGADATGNVTVQERNDPEDDWADVSADDLVGELEALSADEAQWVGYRGNMRYVRANTSAGGNYSVVIVRGLPHLAPTQ